MLDDAPEYEEKRFHIITKNDITAMQDKIITDLSGKLGLTKGEVALVLMVFECVHVVCFRRLPILLIHATSSVAGTPTSSRRDTLISRKSISSKQEL